jgi:DNA-binding CsgD family transcriptional regulator
MVATRRSIAGSLAFASIVGGFSLIVLGGALGAPQVIAAFGVLLIVLGLLVPFLSLPSRPQREEGSRMEPEVPAVPSPRATSRKRPVNDATPPPDAVERKGSSDVRLQGSSSADPVLRRTAGPARARYYTAMIDREAVLRATLAGQPTEEIAAELGIPVEDVREKVSEVLDELERVAGETRQPVRSGRR